MLGVAVGVPMALGPSHITTSVAPSPLTTTQQSPVWITEQSV
jgi:hypothetical protein